MQMNHRTEARAFGIYTNRFGIINENRLAYASPFDTIFSIVRIILGDLTYTESVLQYQTECCEPRKLSESKIAKPVSTI